MLLSLFGARIAEIIKAREKRIKGYFKCWISFIEIPLYIIQIIKKIRNKAEYRKFKKGKASEDIKGRMKIKVSNPPSIVL
jgi:hypothetical protein